MVVQRRVSANLIRRSQLMRSVATTLLCRSVGIPFAALHWSCRLQRSTTETVTAADTMPNEGTGNQAEQGTSYPETALNTMERAAAARREIHDLWNSVASEEEKEPSASVDASMNSEGDGVEATGMSAGRLKAVKGIVEKYKIDVTTPREEDVSRGLGDAMDRLLLLCLPSGPEEGTALLEGILQAAGRQGRQLSVRTIQHLFARTGNYVEALGVFQAMRTANVAMNMEAYHAMLYSLQRLEEEGWAQRFHEEYVASKGEGLTEQALDFILRGVDNQLLPENKPWLGRIMFSDMKENAAAQKQTRASYDELSKVWVERYKNGGASML